LEFPENLSTKGTEQRTEVKNFVTVAFSYSSGFVVFLLESLRGIIDRNKCYF
jgi:hypothetical protein